MENYEYSVHAIDMIIERDIPENWIEETILSPDFTEYVSNEELHFIKQINEYGNRYLKVVVNPFKQPNTIVTIFFDRRIKGKNEIKS